MDDTELNEIKPIVREFDGAMGSANAQTAARLILAARQERDAFSRVLDSTQKYNVQLLAQRDAALARVRELEGMLDALKPKIHRFDALEAQSAELEAVKVACRRYIRDPDWSKGDAFDAICEALGLPKGSPEPSTSDLTAERNVALARVRELEEEVRGCGFEQANYRARIAALEAQLAARTERDARNQDVVDVVKAHLRGIRRLEKEGTWPYGQEGHAEMVGDLRAALDSSHG